MEDIIQKNMQLGYSWYIPGVGDYASFDLYKLKEGPNKSSLMCAESYMAQSG